MSYFLYRETLYDIQILDRYKKALDTSVKIATTHNVKPIRGATYIFCNLSYKLNRPCSSARGLGKPRMVGHIGWWLLTNLRLRLRLRMEFCVQDSISDSGMVIIKILRLSSYSGLSIKLRNPEIGLHLA